MAGKPTYLPFASDVNILNRRDDPNSLIVIRTQWIGNHEPYQTALMRASRG